MAEKVVRDVGLTDSVKEEAEVLAINGAESAANKLEGRLAVAADVRRTRLCHALRGLLSRVLEVGNHPE